MKTTITTRTKNLKKVAREAVKNPFGMVLQNTTEIRAAVASEMHSIIERLHKTAKENKTGKYA